MILTIYLTTDILFPLPLNNLCTLLPIRSKTELWIPTPLHHMVGRYTWAVSPVLENRHIVTGFLLDFSKFNQHDKDVLQIWLQWPPTRWWFSQVVLHPLLQFKIKIEWLGYIEKWWWCNAIWCSWCEEYFYMRRECIFCTNFVSLSSLQCRLRLGIGVSQSPFKEEMYSKVCWRCYCFHELEGMQKNKNIRIFLFSI